MNTTVLKTRLLHAAATGIAALAATLCPPVQAEPVSQNRFRVSVAVFNEMNDIDRLLEVLPKKAS